MALCEMTSGVQRSGDAWLYAPYQFPGLSCGVWWSFLLDIRGLWRHNMTSYSRLQTNVLAKFVETTCIFREVGSAVGKQSGFWGLSPPNWIMKYDKSVKFLSNFRMSSPLNRHNPPLLKTFSRRFSRERGFVRQLRVMETHKKIVNNYVCFCTSTVDLKNNNRNYRKSFWIFWVPE